MILFYIFISYMIMLGMIIETYKDVSSIPKEAYFMFAISPFLLPILIGMMMAESDENNDEQF
jgi:hypothetical protein